MNKYRNKRVNVDGINFDSKAEAAFYGELKLLEKGGEISQLEVHKRFPVEINGQKAFTYVCDFYYFDHLKREYIVADVKGVKTATYRLKKKIFELATPYKITEIAA